MEGKIENESTKSRLLERSAIYQTLSLQKQAQKISPRLYLGPLQIAENADDISNLGITHVLSVLGFDQNIALDASSAKNCNRVWICVEDRVQAEEQMVLALPQAVEQLHEWLSGTDNIVFVHCQSGISRSATVVMAYLMKCCALELMVAYEQVYRSRPVINPNDGFFRALQHFGEHHCNISYSSDGDTRGDKDDDKDDDKDGGNGGRREREVALYNGFQIVAQLSFTGVTLEGARAALDRCGGDVAMAASSVLARFERQNP
jgi:atypical dual specificity phosphatase